MLSRFSHNWTLKLTALVLAVVLWSHVRGQVNPWETATFKARLKSEAPRGFILLNADELPKTVVVTLRGPRLTLRGLKGLAPANPLATAEDAPLLPVSQLQATLDFSGPRKGTRNVPIKAVADIEDVEVVGSKPSEFSVSLDAAETRRFQIEPVVPASDELEIDDVSLSAGRAQVSGPSKLLDRIQSLRARVPRSELKSGTFQLDRVPVEALDEDGEVLRDVLIEPASVRVEVKSRERQSEKSVRLNLKITGRPSDGYEAGAAQVEPSRITIRGTRRALDAIQSLSVEADIRGAREDFSQRVRVNLPAGVEALSSRRVRVNVEINPREQTPVPTPTPGATPISPLPAPEPIG